MQSDFDLYISQRRLFKTVCTTKKQSLEKYRRQDLLNSSRNPKLFCKDCRINTLTINRQ